MKLKENSSVFVIIFIAFLVRFIGIWFDLPEIYTTEEYKVVNYALRMAARKSLNPEFFNYPSLYLYFTLFISGIYFLIGKILGFFSTPLDFAYSFLKNPTGIYLIMRFFSSVWATLSVFMVYLIGKELYNKRTGIFASLLITFNPSIIISAHEIRPNMPSMFLVLLSFYFLIKFYKTGVLKHLYLSAIFAGIATSVFYNALPMLIVLFTGYYFYKKNSHTQFNLWVLLKTSLIFILFFVLGTPYSVLDYRKFLNDFFFHSSGALTNLPIGILGVLNNFIFISNNDWRIPLLGIFCIISLLLSTFEKKLENFFLVLSILVFSLPVCMYHAPGAGYMFQVFALVFIVSGNLLDKIYQKIYPKWLMSIIIIFLIFPSFAETVKLDILYTLKDTRTIAKEWIEKNIPYGTKILIDMAAHSPPIKETKRQLEGLYKKAVELNHYKKEYLKLKLDIHPGENYGYEIYRILRPPEEVSGTIELVKEAQKVQDLVDISGGISILKNKGIEYVIINDKDRNSALNSKSVSLRNFYSLILEKSRLIIRFPQQKTKLQKGPGVFIYKVL